MDISQETHTLFEVDFRNYFLIAFLGLGWRQLPLAINNHFRCSASLEGNYFFKIMMILRGRYKVSQKEAVKGELVGWRRISLHAPTGPVMRQNHGT